MNIEEKMNWLLGGVCGIAFLVGFVIAVSVSSLIMGRM